MGQNKHRKNSLTSRYHEARENLEKTKGIMIRARARWHEHGEKSTEYFLNQEKRNQIKKNIRKLHINKKKNSGDNVPGIDQKRSDLLPF